MGFRFGGLCRWGIVLLFAWIAVVPAWGRTVLDLDTAQQPVALADWGDAWLDAAGDATVARVATDASIPWVPTQQDAIYRLGAGKALWIRFTIPPAPDYERWYLEIPYPSVNRVTLYTADSLGQWQAQTAGDSIPVAQWPVPHRHPLLPVAVSAEDPRKYLLRVENPYAFSAPLSFVSDGFFGRHEQQTSLILGIYFGLAGLAIAVGLLSAASLRDGAYAVYAVSVALMALSQAALTGIGGLHLWPNWARWNDLSPLVLPVLATGSLLWFFSVVVSIQERSRRLFILLAGLAALSIVAAVAVILIDPSLRPRIVAPYVLVSMSIAIVAVVWAARRGDRYAPWVLAGIAPIVGGTVFPLARLGGLIPVSFLTVHGMQLGIATALPILLVVLMVRSQQRREHNRRIQGLDRIDPATGLINRQVFTERLVRMMVRSERLKYQSAVLLIDIANVEQMRRDFGSQAAAELPLRVAGRLLSAAREIDGVARLSEFRFGMLVEGPLTPEDAASAGPRIVARCLMPFEGKPIEWVAQVRIGQTMVPTERADAQQVLQRLEALLAAVPADSKRAVFTLRS